MKYRSGKILWVRTPEKKLGDCWSSVAVESAKVPCQVRVLNGHYNTSDDRGPWYTVIPVKPYMKSEVVHWNMLEDELFETAEEDFLGDIGVL